MAGYMADFSRSKNSQLDIDNGFMPLSLFKRQTIDELADRFLKPEQATIIKKVSVKDFVATAKFIGPASWHHTSSFYNKTNHYDFVEVVEQILTEGVYKPVKKEQATNEGFVVITVSNWEKKRRLKDSTHVCQIKGNWAMEVSTGKKFLLSANRVLDKKYFDTLECALSNVVAN